MWRDGAQYEEVICEPILISHFRLAQKQNSLTLARITCYRLYENSLLLTKPRQKFNEILI